MRGFAFFDLDHTLLPHDTQALFCNYVLRRERWRVLLHVIFAPFVVLKVLRVIGTLRAKRAFMGYLWGMRRTRLRQYAQEFARDSVKAWAYPEIMAEVAEHKAAGRVLVLNTASPDFYARDIARELGFDYCVATQAQLSDPLELHPRIKINNKHDAKIDAMKDQVPGVAALTDEDRDTNCYAYSDSDADLPLLHFGRNGVLIHPASRLATIGIRNEWTLMHPRRPYSSKVGDMLCVVRQMLGLYPERPE